MKGITGMAKIAGLSGMIGLAALVSSFATSAAQPIGAAAGKLQSVKLLSNRYRMDADIEEVTFVIQRKPGTSPVILIRPDGSKLYYATTRPPMQWMMGNTGDMVRIPNPMPGPWQILGDILPGSEIHLASTLALEVDKVPEEMFVSEKIKLTAKLMIDGDLLKIGQVDDLITVLLQITSMNLPEERNFGVGRLTVGKFLDNGRNFDERRGDGVFTGELDLEKPLGHYELTVNASNNAFSREYSQPLLLRPTPVKLEPRPSDDGRQFTVKIVTNASVVNFTKQHIQFQLKHPSGGIEELSINDLNPIHTLELESATSPGRYQLSAQVAGVTNQGRDFMLELKPLKFSIARPPVVEVEETAEDIANSQQATSDVIPDETPAKEQGLPNWLVILLINLVVISLGGLLMWFFMRKPSPPKPDKEEVPAEG